MWNAFFVNRSSSGAAAMAPSIALSCVSSVLFALLISSADSSSQIELPSLVEDDCHQGECYGMDMFPGKSLNSAAMDHIRESDSRAKTHAKSAETANSRARPNVNSAETSDSKAHSNSNGAGMAVSRANLDSNNAEMTDPRVNPASNGAEMTDSRDNIISNGAEMVNSRIGPYANKVQMPEEHMELLIVKQQNQLDHLERLVDKLHHTIDKLQNELLRPLGRVRDHEKSCPTTMRVFSEGEETPIMQHGIPVAEGEEASLLTENLKIEEGKRTDRESEDLPSRQSAIDMAQPPWKKPQHVPGRGYSGRMTVARYKPAWSEHFQFLSAVKVDGEVTCLHVLSHEGEEGLSKYVAVGVDTGRVYIFLSHGDLLVDFPTVSHYPVTAMVSFPLKGNETMFLTGHSDGTALMHKLWEMTLSGPSHGDDWNPHYMEHIQSLTSTGSHDPVASDAISSDEESGLVGKPAAVDKSVTILEVYRVGKMRYILESDAKGKIQVFRENGTFYGAAKAPSQPLAFLRSPNSQRLLFLTQDGAASLDLRSLSVRSGPCEGLNGSSVIAYAFDAAGRSKAYGFTAQGYMIYVALSGDTLHFECHVRFKRKFEVEGPVVPQGIKGYFLVATPMQVLVYNTTLQVGYSYNSIPMGVPRLLFTASTDEISLSFLGTPIPSKSQPVMACNRERLVVLGFADGYVGIYKSNLPVQKPANFNSKFWSSPLFVIILMLLGGWHFFGKKRDTPLSMNTGSEISLASSSVAVPGYSRSGLDEPREALLDSRRYSSPSKAFPGSTSGYSHGSLKFRNPIPDQSFRTSSMEPQVRGSSSVEPSLRTLEPHSYLKREAAEPKFRASAVEPGFRSSLAETNSFLKKDLVGLKPTRGSSSVEPSFKTLSEPNSF